MKIQFVRNCAAARSVRSRKDIQLSTVFVHGANRIGWAKGTIVDSETADDPGTLAVFPKPWLIVAQGEAVPVDEAGWDECAKHGITKEAHRKAFEAQSRIDSNHAQRVDMQISKDMQGEQQADEDQDE